MLEVSGVTLRFGGLQALRDVSLSVARGDLFGLIGPNGAGKSSLLNCINSFYKPTAGAVKFVGRDLGRLQPHQVARLGISRTFQTSHMFQDLSVIETCLVGRHGLMPRNLLEIAFSTARARREEREAEAQVRQILERLGLRDWADRHAAELPNGLQKRVEIARALSAEPQLLLLDEPASGLTPEEVDEIRQLIVELNRSGLTVIVVEHNVELIMAISTRVAVLHHGSLLTVGAPSEVRANPEVQEAYLGRAP
jgi:branched-chain amino acid transport system ATP-binding protein